MKVTWFDRRLKVRPRLLFERAVRRRPGAGLGLGSSWSPGCPFYRRWRRPMALGTAEGSGPSRLVPRGPEGASVRENIPNQLCRVPGPATSALYGTGVSTDGAAWALSSPGAVRRFKEVRHRHVLSPEGVVFKPPPGESALHRALFFHTFRTVSVMLCVLAPLS